MGVLDHGDIFTQYNKFYNTKISRSTVAYLELSCMYMSHFIGKDMAGNI